MARQISRQDFEARFPQRLPDEPVLRDAMGFMRDTVAFNGIYADLRRAGLTHEDATIAAQRAITGEVRSTNPLPENDNNRAIAGLPPQGVIPEEQRIAQLTPEQVLQYQAIQQRLTQPRVQQVSGESSAAAVEKSASRLAQLQDAVENAVNQSPEWAQSGLRLAGRWTLPALAGLAGFSALALLTGPEQRSYEPQEQQGDAISDPVVTR